ncbi:hypothetical protein [Herbaspirillum lusitanum]|uniref:hypothetical protein n=1 Tax=Herbaspirillum lusitanum TaxID=213312 RepID=UPI001EE65FBD|nr:hypothetical protein [Herbaspirillum lusitanum]
MSNAADAPIAVAEDGANAGAVANPNWHLSLRFSPDVLRDGLDPLSFLRYLLTMGSMVYAHVIDLAIPAADDMDAELCYLGFEIGFASTAGREEIDSVFEFVREGSDIVILAPHSQLTTYGHWLQGLPERAEVALHLLQSGALTAAEWRQLQLDVAEADDLVTTEKRPGVVPSQIRAAIPALRQRGGEEKKSHEQKFIKIEVSKLDQLIDLVGELVIAGAGASLVAKRKKDQRFEEATQVISGLVEQIRDAALTLRMVQINEVFQRFPRV